MPATPITLEEVESLAAQIVAETESARASLARLIAAEAKILAGREPKKFTRWATEYRDEEGHYDTSFPPEQKYVNYSGPRLLRLIGRETETVHIEGGFYHDWKMVTTFGGLYVGLDGAIFASEMSGTGHFGQFAAHPGDCGVECEIEWRPAAAEAFTTEQLAAAESALRELAFPLSAAA